MMPPCKGCERRTVHPNCHATCKEYSAFNIERQKIRNRRYDDFQSATARKDQILKLSKAKHERR